MAVSSPNPALYRPNVGIMMINSEHHVFVAQRLDVTEPAWQMPQGGVDEGELPYHAALRELQEEIGVSQVKLIRQLDEWLYYDFPPLLQSKLCDGAYLGQRQQWFLVRFLGKESDINLATEHPEFSAWRWVPLHKVPDLAIDFKKPLYKKVCAAFQDDVFSDSP